VTQQARNLNFSGLFERMRFMIHDHDSKFAAAFDEVFRSEGIKVIHTPIRAPQANAYAERFVRTVRAECLDWLLIIGRRHLERVLRVYTAHYSRERLTADSRCTRPNHYRHRTTEHRQDRAPRPARWTDPRIPPRRRMNQHFETPQALNHSQAHHARQRMGRRAPIVRTSLAHSLWRNRMRSTESDERAGAQARARSPTRRLACQQSAWRLS
jgi:Integrase core domain